MTPVVADTHALVWYLATPQRLSDPARAAFREAANAGLGILVSAISMVEVAYLVEKGRLPTDLVRRIHTEVADPESAVTVVPVDTAVARVLRQVPRDEVPDMPDRIIAATAVCLNLPLVTRDGRIRASGVQTIW